MDFYHRLTQYHSTSRSSFILFTELAAIAGAMAVIVGIAFLLEILG